MAGAAGVAEGGERERWEASETVMVGKLGGVFLRWPGVSRWGLGDCSTKLTCSTYEEIL